LPPCDKRGPALSHGGSGKAPFSQAREGWQAATRLPAVAQGRRAALRAFWEIIWMLGGGLLLTMATVAGAMAATCLLGVCGVAFWRRRRKRPGSPD